MRSSCWKRMTVTIAGAFLAILPPLSACQICLPMPTESVADRILSAKHLMLAREDPGQPYQLVNVRTLKGDLSEVPPVDLFLDASTRRQLVANPELSLLCGWFEKEEGWRRLALHDETVAPVVATILARAGEWETDPDARLDYFAGFLGHEDAELADLAHLEIARAPYAKLLQYADRIPREQLHEELRNYRRMKWHALYLLFLGGSGDPRDHDFIREGLADAARYGLATRTAAFATALIEIDGGEGIERIREIYFGGMERRPEELASIHAALRVHGDQGAPELRDAVVATYGDLLEQEPTLAADLADDLTRWERYDHAGALSESLTENPPDLPALARIRKHLRAAAGTGETSSTTSTGNAGTKIPVLALAVVLFFFPLILLFHKLHRSRQMA